METLWSRPIHNAWLSHNKLSFTLLVVLGLSLGGCKTRSTAPTPEPIPKPTVTPQPTRQALAHPKLPKKPSVFFGVKTKRKVFALTFDDGPDPHWTPQILAILKQWHAPATFFMVGKMVRVHLPFALQVEAAGYPIGNHTWSHPRTPKSSYAEVARTDAILQKDLRIKPTLFRPPYGILDNGLAQEALARGENVIVWNSQGADWDKKATAETIEAKVLKKAKPGGIVLLHDGGGNRSRTIAALPHIIDRLRRQGYRFVTVPELLTIGPPLHTPPSFLQPPKKRTKHLTKAKSGSKPPTKHSLKGVGLKEETSPALHKVKVQ